MATALAALVPDLTAVDYGDTLALLAKHGVKTDVDLLCLDAGTVPDCPAQMLRALQGLISGWLVPTPTSGTALLAAVTSRPRISSVLPGLDVMLGGGFEPGSVVEITGGRGSRKSLFALNILLLHMLLHTASRATFVDTTNSFDAQICLDIVLFHIPRLQEQGQFLSTSNTPSANASDPHAIAISVLNRLTISACFTVAKTFEAIESTLRTKDYGEGKLELVVIDQVETLVGGATLSAASAKGHAVMIAFLKRLHSLSCDPENPLVTFLINPTIKTTYHKQPPLLSRFRTRDQIFLSPGLGTPFTHLTDQTLFLTDAQLVWPVEGTGKSIVELARNKKGQSRGWTIFGLEGSGLEEVVP